jgi:dipeptidyl aminopeptidase/acylaminoacyl peptidase
MKRFAYVSIMVALLLAGCAPRLAGLPPLIPRQLFFENSERSNPQISPDAKHLAFLAPDSDNVPQIWTRGLSEQVERQLTNEKKRGVRHYTWTYDNEHVIYAQDTNGDENWHVHAVSILSGNLRNLTPYRGVQARLVAMDPLHPNTLLVAMNLRDRRYFDVYRVHIGTGETLMINRNNGRQLWWTPDSNLRIRTAMVRGGLTVRDGDRRPWRLLRRFQAAEPAALYGYSNDGKNLYLRGVPVGGDTGALIAVDVETGQETVIAHDPTYDVQSVFTHPHTGEIQALSFYKDKLEWKVIDPSVTTDFNLLAKLGPGEFSVVHDPYYSPMLPSHSLGRRDLQDRYWIVSHEADDEPVKYYLYDRAAKTTSFLFAARPRLASYKLAKVRPVSYLSRDGLTLHGYLTTPVGVARQSLPTVLLVHGGPWQRDRWGYYDVVQWLANRGYAVLQVNYRGSTGYGRNFVLASYKEWGAKMHDDLIDGVNWLIKAKIADPKRVAIMGGSYGGYAALVGVTLTPDVFAAGISRVGISNLITVEKSRPAYWSITRDIRARRVGDPDKEEEMLKSRSPFYFVDNIKAPLLIAHGANDVRVVAAESTQMVEAMLKANKPVEYFVYDDEGHSLFLPGNKYHFYTKAEEFLARHLSGRFEPTKETDPAPAHRSSEMSNSKTDDYPPQIGAETVQ